MNRKVIFLLVSVLLASSMSVKAADPDFIAASVEVDPTNGEIDSTWSGISTYSTISSFNGDVKFGVNSTHLFALLSIDTSKTWVSIEFNADGSTCMASGNDGWELKIGDDTVTLDDITYSGTSSPSVDITTDLVMEYVFSGSTVDVEMSRPLAPTDAKDFDFSTNNSTVLLFASNTDHFTATTEYTLQLENVSASPETSTTPTSSTTTSTSSTTVDETSETETVEDTDDSAGEPAVALPYWIALPGLLFISIFSRKKK
ncbi:MAG: hypothetical protein INQ03_24305 [Candidatus Heimdallarchaeota archaeon]|nr:hypothetical protein [Candidatus Heimdallarchaeota archaeon]